MNAMKIPDQTTLTTVTLMPHVPIPLVPSRVLVILVIAEMGLIVQVSGEMKRWSKPHVALTLKPPIILNQWLSGFFKYKSV